MAIPVLFLLVVAEAIAVVVLLAARRRRKNAPALPSCGKCGYVVQGLPTFTCPECGSDLREAGIITSTQRRPFGPLARASLWTLILPVPALLFTVLAAMTILPTRVTRNETWDLVGPASGAYGGLRVLAKGDMLSWPSQPATPALTQISFEWAAGDPPRVGPLAVDLQTKGYRYQKADHTRVAGESGCDAGVIRDWLRENGVDVTSAGVEAEINALAGIVTAGNLNAIPSAVFASASKSAGGGYISPGGDPRLLLGFWLVVWLIGLWFCIRRRRGAAAQPAEAAASTK